MKFYIVMQINGFRENRWEYFACFINRLHIISKFIIVNNYSGTLQLSMHVATHTHTHIYFFTGDTGTLFILLFNRISFVLLIRVPVLREITESLISNTDDVFAPPVHGDCWKKAFHLFITRVRATRDQFRPRTFGKVSTHFAGRRKPIVRAIVCGSSRVCVTTWNYDGRFNLRTTYKSLSKTSV